MRKIPNKLREEMAEDPYYQQCCLSYTGMCEGRIEWHHALRYASQQQNYKFCILPLCHAHHLKADSKIIKPLLEKIMTARATEEEKKLFPKRQWLKV
jgi:hypothetical protein